MKSKFVFIAILFSLIAGSCEFAPDDENFIERVPPADFAMVEITLFEQGDSIIVIDNTDFQYKLDTQGKEFISGVIRLEDNVWEMQNSSGSFFVNPLACSYGYHTLTMEFIFSSGTGSIAESFGLEGYIGQMEWVVFIDNRPPPDTPLSFHQNNDGYLTITWPVCKQLNFDSYQLQRYEHPSTTNYIIKDINQNFFIDSCYFGSEVTYHIKTEVKGRPASWFSNFKTIKEEKRTFHYENHGPDSLLIWWNKIPYPAKYSLRGNMLNQFYLYKSSDTLVVVQKPDIGSHQDLFFEVSHATNTGCNPYINTMNDSYRYIYGRMIGSDWGPHAYNPIDNVIYAKFFSSIRVIDAKTMGTKWDVGFNNFYHNVYFASANTTSQFATCTENKIFIYGDQTLKYPQTIDFGEEQLGPYLFLSDNDYVAFVKDNKYTLMKITGQSVFGEFDFNQNRLISESYILSTSSDARYAAYISQQDYALRVFERSDLEFASIIADNLVKYQSVCFNPLFPDQLVVSLVDHPMIIVNKLPEFSALQTIVMDQNVIVRNIDPHTGFLLATSANRAYVVDLTKGRVITSLRIPENSWGYSNCNLFRNKIVFSSGIFLDLSEFLTEQVDI